MTRPLKFRAWAIRQKCMEEITDLYWFEAQGVHGLDWDGDGSGYQGHFDTYVLMQHTGLKDINGVGIYEGDLIETDRPGSPIFEVYWRTEFGMWFLRAVDGHLEFLFGSMGNQHTNKVVGNICEHRHIWEADA